MFESNLSPHPRWEHCKKGRMAVSVCCSLHLRRHNQKKQPVLLTQFVRSPFLCLRSAPAIAFLRTKLALYRHITQRKLHLLRRLPPIFKLNEEASSRVLGRAASNYPLIRDDASLLNAAVPFHCTASLSSGEH